MSLKNGVAKKILTQLIIKGALGCTTLTLTLTLTPTLTLTLTLTQICSGPGRGREGGVLEGV